jgi:hypothetical protein
MSIMIFLAQRTFVFCSLLASIMLIDSCAIPHRYTMGDLDATSAPKKHFKIIVSERGYNFEGGITIAQVGLLSANRSANLEGAKDLEYLKLLIAVSTMGPVTGQKLFNSDYANEMSDIIFQHCKSGKIINLQSIRESAVYPVVSGEIVRIEGDCLE